MCDIRTYDEQEVARPTGVHTFVNELLLALTNARVYSADHPRVRTSLEALSRSLETHLDALQREVLQIGASESYLFFDQRPLISASQAAPRLLHILASVGAGGLSFMRGAGAHDFLALARLLARKNADSLDVLTANLELERAGSDNVRLLAAYDAGQIEDAGTAGGEGGTRALPVLEVPAKLYRGVFDHLTDVVTSVFRGHLFRLDETRGFVENILKNLGQGARSLASAGRYEHSDADQFQFRHSIRVACLALNFARGLTRDEKFLERIGTAALLHDVGKGRLDWTILHNPGRLSDEERREMERHTVLGAETLLDMEDCDPMAVAIAFGHHRTLAGGGYPVAVHEPDLSLATRLIKICDVYEALTARRPYKDPMSPTRSYRIMMNMNQQSGGSHFDLQLLHRFILVNGVYPEGSWVLLDSGEVACVQRQSDRLEAPIVTAEKEIGRIGDERAYFNVQPRMIDLRRPDRGSMRNVVSWLSYTEPEAA